MNSILSKLGIEALNPMQLAAVENITANNNTLLLSPTGSGKTLAYLLPLFKNLKPEHDIVQAIILAPSRELALQIESVWRSMQTGFKINAFYGGHAMEVETSSLQHPPTVIVGTPGRIADHFTRSSFSGNHAHTLIFDEFDKSLEFGFQDQMAYIMQKLPNITKKVLVSATQGIKIPEFIEVNELKTLNFLNEEASNENLQLKYVKAFDRDGIQTLIALISQISQTSTIIFCNQRDIVENVAASFSKKGIGCSIFHGGMEQIDREKSLIRFRNGSSRYLITTDLAARGLDIPEVENVIHFQLPVHEHEFTHRNGRTARMNAEGVAYLILQQEDRRPAYITELPELLELSDNFSLPKASEWTTIYISGGKKNKINKVDIVGFCLQKGGLDKTQLGKIEVKDFVSYIAVESSKIDSFLKKVSQEKLKGKKMKIEVAR